MKRRTHQEYRRKTRALSIVLVLLLLLPNLVACTTEAETTGTTQAATTEATTPVITLSPEELLVKEIKDAYRALTATTAADEAITVDIYGEFGDALALKITKDATVLDLEFEIIANREFLYDTEGRLYVYANKTLSPLAAAHTAGIVTDENIRTLYDSFRGANEALYTTYVKEKPEINITEEDEYFTDYISVILQPFARKKEYTPEDFKEIGCTSVERDEFLNGDVWFWLGVADMTKAQILEAGRLLYERCDIYSWGVNRIYYYEPG